MILTLIHEITLLDIPEHSQLPLANNQQED